MRPARVLVIFLFALCLSTAQETTTYIGHYLEPFPGPQVYKDPNSGTLFYVETDGRHVAAISDKGKLLWSKDPFKDAHLPFYRTEKPNHSSSERTLANAPSLKSRSGAIACEMDSDAVSLRRRNQKSTPPAARVKIAISHTHIRRSFNCQGKPFSFPGERFSPRGHSLWDSAGRKVVPVASSFRES